MWCAVAFFLIVCQQLVSNRPHHASGRITHQGNTM
jgi:hypothetical protein